MRQLQGPRPRDAVVAVNGAHDRVLRRRQRPVLHPLHAGTPVAVKVSNWGDDDGLKVDGLWAVLGEYEHVTVELPSG